MTTTTTNSNGTLNIARLIEEAEAQLIGEQNSSCSSCGNCNAERSHFAGRCSERQIKNAARRPLVATTQR